MVLDSCVIVYDPRMDAIDTALDGLRVTGSMVGRTLVDPPWGLALDSTDPCVLAAVVRGELWATYGDHEPRHLAEGDVLIADGGAFLRLGDRPDAELDVVVTDRDVCYDPATGADLSESCRVGGRTFGDPEGSVSILVGAYYVIGELYRLLAADLPGVIVLPADAQTAPILAVIEHETASARPGQQVTVDRLMELLAITSLRSWLQAGHTDVPTWATALEDPVVGPALRAMHDEPERPWTVAGLAATAAVSRALFARRFTQAVGVGPLTHLTRWRMAVATDLMRADPRCPLATIAAQVGYGDPFSFSAAYRRVRGQAPSAARRANAS